MSSRRDLKKTINGSLDLLYIDCVLYTVTSKQPNFEKLEIVLSDLNKTRKDLLSRMSIAEGKDIKSRTKAYYRKVKSDLKTEVDRIGKEIEALD